MITGTIVLGALLFAAIFCLAWLVKPALRDRIESPKHEFQERLRRYDRECQEADCDESS